MVDEKRPPIERALLLRPVSIFVFSRHLFFLYCI